MNSNDARNVEFDTSRKGYDPDQVTEFANGATKALSSLESVIEDLELRIQERDADKAALQARIDEFLARDEAQGGSIEDAKALIANAIMEAQTTAARVVADAETKAKVLAAEAEDAVADRVEQADEVHTLKLAEFDEELEMLALRNEAVRLAITDAKDGLAALAATALAEIEDLEEQMPEAAIDDDLDEIFSAEDNQRHIVEDSNEETEDLGDDNDEEADIDFSDEDADEELDEDDVAEPDTETGDIVEKDEDSTSSDNDNEDSNASTDEPWVAPDAWTADTDEDETPSSWS